MPAAIPANRVAKQAALAHTLFNTLGVLLVISTFWFRWGDSGIPVFFYLVDWMTNGDAFAALPQNVPRHIANAHTLFNLLTTLLLHRGGRDGAGADDLERDLDAIAGRLLVDVREGR